MEAEFYLRATTGIVRSQRLNLRGGISIVHGGSQMPASRSFIKQERVLVRHFCLTVRRATCFGSRKKRLAFSLIAESHKRLIRSDRSSLPDKQRPPFGGPSSLSRLSNAQLAMQAHHCLATRENSKRTPRLLSPECPNLDWRVPHRYQPSIAHDPARKDTGDGCHLNLQAETLGVKIDQRVLALIG